VIERMANSYEEVTESEGFNEVVVVSEHEAEIEHEHKTEEVSGPYLTH
jgi:hypothetical protein